MKKRSRPPQDLRLKIVIISQRYTQRRVALETRIGETRFSEIVGHRGATASRVEQVRIAKFLGVDRTAIFSEDEMAWADLAALGDEEAKSA